MENLSKKGGADKKTRIFVQTLSLNWLSVDRVHYCLNSTFERLIEVAFIEILI